MILLQFSEGVRHRTIPPARMPLSPELTRIAETFIETSLQPRSELTRDAVNRRHYDAQQMGRTSTGFYVVDQQEACIAEIDFRANAIWNAYRRVVVEGRVLWTRELRDQILARVNQMLDNDVPVLEEMVRNAVVQYGHGFRLFLREARPSLIRRLSAELDLFALQHRPVGGSVRDQLAAPRYHGPQEHWVRVDRAMSQSPPDLATGAREAINAVEGLAKVVTALPTGTLGDCVKKLRADESIDGATVKALEALWGFANASPGLRHGAHIAPTLSQPEAEYVIEHAEAMTRLLLSIDALGA